MDAKLEYMNWQEKSELHEYWTCSSRILYDRWIAEADAELREARTYEREHPRSTKAADKVGELTKKADDLRQQAKMYNVYYSADEAIAKALDELNHLISAAADDVKKEIDKLVEYAEDIQDSDMVYAWSRHANAMLIPGTVVTQLGKLKYALVNRTQTAGRVIAIWREWQKNVERDLRGLASSRMDAEDVLKAQALSKFIETYLSGWRLSKFSQLDSLYRKDALYRDDLVNTERKMRWQFELDYRGDEEPERWDYTIDLEKAFIDQGFYAFEKGGNTPWSVTVVPAE